MNFERDGVPAQILYKRLAIFFDEVIFNPRWCPIGASDLFKTHTDYLAMLVASDVDEARCLAKDKNFKSIFINCWDYVEDVDQFELKLDEILEEELINKIFSYSYEKCMPKNAFLHTNEFKQLCGDMWRDLQLYIGFKEIEPSAAANLSSNFSEIFSDFASSEVVRLNELSFSSVQIPDFGDLSWDQIFDLRKDPLIKYFREKIYSSFDKLNYFDNEILNTLWDVTSYVKPNIKGTIIKSIFSNIPTPTILNPVGVGLAVKETIDEINLNRSKGWLFFIQKARMLSAKGQER